MVSRHAKLAVLAVLMMAILPSEGSSNNLRKKRHNHEVERKQHQREVAVKDSNGATPYPRKDSLKRKLAKDKKNKNNKGGNQQKNNQQQKNTQSTQQQKQDSQKEDDKNAHTVYSKNCKAQGGKMYGFAFECEYGGQANQPIYLQNLPPETFGTCQTMHPCLCGVNMNFFAKRCPCKCRPFCGGQCASKAKCPKGFALRPDGTHVDEFDYSKIHDDYNGQYAWFLGTPQCGKPF